MRLYNDDLSYDQTLVTGGFTAFTDVPYGTYNYTLSKDCQETVEGTTTVECTPGDIDALVAAFGINRTTNDLFINLTPPGGIGFPPTGVTVRLYNDDLSYDQTLVTGGFTAFTDVPYGTYSYTLSKDCQETVEGTTTVECTPGDIDALIAEFGINQTIDASVTEADGALTANATGVSYQWITCDGTEITGETDSIFTPTVSGDYAVVITAENCSESVTSECITYIITGTNALNIVGLSFYPNPVQDELRIDFEQTVKDIQVRLFNINGQLMINRAFSQAELITLDVSKLFSGTYILDLTVQGKSLKTPIVKM